AVSAAEEFVYLSGKSLEELFPTKKDDEDQRLANTIRYKLKSGTVKFKFVLANPYDPDFPFRKECEERMWYGAAVLWQPAKFTIEQILKLNREIAGPTTGQNKDKLDLRIIRDLMPYAILITERTLIVQHYIPYVNGRIGAIMEIAKSDTGAKR